MFEHAVIRESEHMLAQSLPQQQGQVNKLKHEFEHGLARHDDPPALALALTFAFFGKQVPKELSDSLVCVLVGSPPLLPKPILMD